MSQRQIIFISDGAWRVGIMKDGELRMIALPHADETVSSRVQQVKRELVAAGYAGQNLLLALPSAWCLSATVSTDKLGRGDRRQSMAFRLEEHLPLSAEEFIADYIEAGDGTALGVGAELVKLRELVDAFSAAELSVQHICPMSLLAASHVATGEADIRGVFISTEYGGCDFIELEKGRPVRWLWFVHNDPVGRQHLTEWRKAAGGGGKVYELGVDALSMDPDVAELHGEGNTCIDLKVEEASAIEGTRILDGASRPWIEFRRDSLAFAGKLLAYRKPLIALAVAGLLVLVCLSGVAQWRGRRYQALALQQQREEGEIFKRLFPDQRVPAGVKARLVGEQKKLAALQGQAGGGVLLELTSASSTLRQLRDFLKCLPADVPFQIQDLDFELDYIRVEGKAQSHVDAERLTVALRQSGMFEVEAPKTQTLKEGGVSFSFVAKARSDASRTKGAS